MNSRKAYPFVATFIFGFATATLWQRAMANFYFRPVQRLSSQDGSHIAVLERADGPLDLNFRILLDDRKLYISPDFASDPSLSYRETLLWDESGRQLILEVLGHRLFGYSMQSREVLSEDELLRAKIIPPPDSALTLEGRWPGAKP